jgi:hypothetical protein
MILHERAGDWSAHGCPLPVYFFSTAMTQACLIQSPQERIGKSLLDLVHEAHRCRLSLLSPHAGSNAIAAALKRIACEGVVVCAKTGRPEIKVTKSTIIIWACKQRRGWDMQLVLEIGIYLRIAVC